MERKKSKHSVLFPKSLDMEQFLNSPADGNKKRKHAEGSKYYLRGVLLHKGPSAYHGHYEAQIFDVKYVAAAFNACVVLNRAIYQESGLVPVQRRSCH